MNPRTLLFISLLSVAIPVYASEMAAGSYSTSQINSNTFHYDLALSDPGTTNIGTFWFAWIPGDDFMPTNPMNISAPAGWSFSVTGGVPGDGYAIRWIAGGSSALTPGSTLTGFGFDSMTTPAQLAGNSPFFSTQNVSTSFVYSGAPFSDPGFRFLVQAGPQTGTPDPASAGLIAVGGLLLVSPLLRRSRNSQS
jgi:hypothetical protein